MPLWRMPLQKLQTSTSRFFPQAKSSMPLPMHIRWMAAALLS